MSTPRSAAHRPTAARFPMPQTKAPSSRPVYLPSRSAYRVAMTASNPSASARGDTMSIGEVVARTSLLPSALWAASTSGAHG